MILAGTVASSSGQIPFLGGVVFTSGPYTYHKFTASGSLVVNRTSQTPLTLELFLVGGGGSGGTAGTQGASGGGGAGGLRLESELCQNKTYSITVGAGGINSNGTTTVFSSIDGNSYSAIGGGRGASPNSSVFAGSNGGSGGGGGAANPGTTGNGGLGFSSQGQPGGNGLYNATFSSLSRYAAGGGGGAAGAGGNASNGTTSVVGGVGGSGTASYNDWLSATQSGVVLPADGLRYIAGGGGGGNNVGGSGGGGGNGSSGTAGTGSGGAGRRNTTISGGNGGGGIVLVRYLTDGV